MSPKLKTIKYADLVNTLLGSLSDREREVLQKRNSLADFPKYTLEQIGKDFNITRERVRQIEKDSLKKVKKVAFSQTDLPVKDLESLIFDYLDSHGGIMAEPHLVEKLINHDEAEEQRALMFFLNYILDEKFDRVNHSTDFNIIWKLDNIDLEQVIDVVSALKSIIEDHGQPLHMDDLSEKFASHEYFQFVNEQKADNQAILETLLRLRKDIAKNLIDQWGFNNWNTIRPKRMTDKAYLVLLKEGRPLHFEEVADLINQAKFDRKKAVAATVHNELILDDKYVLVGRGIYALKDWGYEKGTVADIIAKVLQDNGPMTKKDLMEEVLKQRLVQKTTITLVLMNKDKFKRDESGKYILA